MKRINLFVLLCVLVFGMCAGAWAEETTNAPDVIIGPMYENGSESNNNTHIQIFDYKNTENNSLDIEAKVVSGDGSENDPWLIQISTDKRGVPPHHNGANQYGYWLDVGIAKDTETGYTYSWGWTKNGETKNTNTSSMTKDNKNYDTFYWGVRNTFSHLSNGTLTVTKTANNQQGNNNNGEGDKTYYNVDFSNLLTASNDFVDLRTDAQNITATSKTASGDISVAFDTNKAAHEVTVKVTGGKFLKSGTTHIVSLDVPIPTGVTGLAYYSGNKSALDTARSDGNTIRTFFSTNSGSAQAKTVDSLSNATSYKYSFDITDFVNSKFEESTKENETAADTYFLALKYTGANLNFVSQDLTKVSNTSNGVARVQYLLYKFDFSEVSVVDDIALVKKSLSDDLKLYQRTSEKLQTRPRKLCG